MRDYHRQEVTVRRAIRSAMARATRLTNDALRLGVRIVQSKARTSSPAVRAMFFMASRLLNDVRACELLAQTGYPLQALAGAATAFELTYRALYIDTNDSRAQVWATHNNLRHSYPKVLKDAMRTVYRERKLPEKMADDNYTKRYGPLAAAKHGNPRAMQQFGLQSGGDTLHIFLGPVDEPATTRAGQIAMTECVRLLGMVLGDLVDNQIQEPDRTKFQKALNRLAGRAHRLNAALASSIVRKAAP